MKTFIITHTVLTKQNIVGTIVNNYWDTIVRKAEANSKAEAIGMFVIQTKNIKAKEKLDILCYELDQLRELELQT